MNGLTTNYDVVVQGEVLGLLALLAAAAGLWLYARRGGNPLRVRGLALSLLSGVLLYLAFPPFDLGWLAWLALVPMILAQLTCGVPTAARPAPSGSRLRRILRRLEWPSIYQALSLVVAYGLVFMHVFPSELPTGFPFPVWPFILLAVALVGCIFALTGLPGGALSFHRKTGFRFFIIGPALGWMGLEQVRVITEAGQSWARIPASQHADIPLLQLSTFGGEWLVGALVIAANYAIALLLLRALQSSADIVAMLLLPRKRTLRPAPVIPDHASVQFRSSVILPKLPETGTSWEGVLLPCKRSVRSGGGWVGVQPILALALVVAAHVVGSALISTPSQTVRVAAIQLGEDLGDSDHYMTFWNVADWHGMDEAVLADIEPMIREAAARGAKVIALPEAVLWEDPALNPLLEQRLLNIAKSAGAYVTFTFYLWHDPLSRNEVYTATPSGQWLGPYAKNHPIAYIGEYSVTAGQFPVYDTGFGGLGNFVCYDNTYTDVAAHLASLGASILTSSNHDWPEGAWGFYTQSIFRATENRMAIVRSDWRVGSAIIDPFGRVLASAKLGARERTILVADVPVVLERGTVYTRTGDWLANLGLATLAAMLLFNVPWPRRRVPLAQPA